MAWTVAYDRWALAACFTGQMNLVAAMAHKDVVMQIALQAPPSRFSRPPPATARARHGQARGVHKSTALAVIYDELARREWADRASGSSSFDVNRDALQQEQSLYVRAEREYTARGHPKLSERQQKGSMRSPKVKARASPIMPRATRAGASPGSLGARPRAKASTTPRGARSSRARRSASARTEARAPTRVRPRALARGKRAQACQSARARAYPRRICQKASLFLHHRRGAHRTRARVSRPRGRPSASRHRRQ